ncbi:hemicentin-1-like [Syngnathus scovelli]|uniref:hemicentin-1-like n=1 Tax=Syngnathus scovelli TaxID=161590 RepID=UPI00211000C1|nr:hemicentin-1-like isoform X1 [Syngnathus scovelli]XP_049611470.1 hemicentin-1-like isoform X2 [Syngnathus scovelli]
MRIFSMRVALVLLLLSPWRHVKPEAGSSCTCALDKACSCSVGQSVTLDSGESSVKVTWTKDGAEIKQGKATYTDGTDDTQKATMTQLTKEDSGLYKATWTSGSTQTTKSFTVAVAPVICTVHQVCAVTKGHSFQLPSSLTGVVKWGKGGAEVTDKFEDAVNKPNLISQADTGAAGMYVAIEGTDVTKMKAFLVQVHDPVTSVRVERVAKKQVSLSCIASGSFKELKWKEGGKPVTDGENYKLRLKNAQLIIKDVPAEAGAYTCVAVQFDDSEKESPTLHLSSVDADDDQVLLPKPGSGSGGGDRSSALAGPSDSNALLVLCVLLLQLYWMV